jgi:hypothetical protein
MAEEPSRLAKDLAKRGIPIPDVIISEATKRGVNPQVLMQQFMDKGGDKLIRMAVQAQEMDNKKARKETLAKLGKGIKKAGSWALRRGIPGVGLATGLFSSKPAGAGSDIVTPTRKRGGSIKRKRGGTVSRKRGSKIMQGYKAGGKV